MESRELIDHQEVLTQVVSENPPTVQQKKQKKCRDKVLKTQAQAIDYILNSEPSNVSSSISKYLSVFDPKNHQVFIGNNCAEIHFKAASKQRMDQIWLGPSIFIRLLEPNLQFKCECFCQENTMVIRFKIKNSTQQDINNFILRLKFLNFIKTIANRKQVTNDKILRWTKEGYRNLIQSITDKLIEQVEKKDLAREKIKAYFSQEIKYKNIPSELSQDNSMDNIQSYAAHQENQKEHSLALLKRLDAIAYLESRILQKTEGHKKYNNDILNAFLWFFQKENFKLTVDRQYAEIRANTFQFSGRMMTNLSVGLKTFSCIFVPSDNVKLKCSGDGKTMAMRFEFKNGVVSQEIYNIISRINFVNFAKNNLGYNYTRIHKLFSLIIERTDIFEALREKIKKKHPNDQAILDRVHYYLRGLIDCEAIDRFLEDGDFLSDTIIMPAELPPSLQAAEENALESSADLGSTEITIMAGSSDPANESQVNENVEGLEDPSNHGLEASNEGQDQALQPGFDPSGLSFEQITSVIDLPASLLTNRQALYESFQFDSDAYTRLAWAHNRFDAVTQHAEQIERPTKQAKIQ
ncbi:MAG: hypothetical protein A3F12_06415 [Gammaproteobacteria bacterium RIFCSPHIGHO2_12_FULL_38_14]|nr:MAG: hypothetical protein A3F12_06415 [Gammaproteobacteria bacterium RIFCSPHIGHO2_12_FULL_38_14]